MTLVPLNEDEQRALSSFGANRDGVGMTGGPAFQVGCVFSKRQPFWQRSSSGLPREGQIGIFESNSIMRTVARLGEKRFSAVRARSLLRRLRIDSFLDGDFSYFGPGQARSTYLSLLDGTVNEAIHARTKGKHLRSMRAEIECALFAASQFAGRG